MQKQNEPSIAVSTRNPDHLLAAANDYRTVDIPIPGEVLPGQEEQVGAAGDAWIGVFFSYDGGESWTSTLLPGFPQDLSPEGLASPLKQLGFTAAADPVVRAGTNGLFFICGLAFKRLTNESAIFVARYIDNNNNEAGDCIEYIDTKIVVQGNDIWFLDKPWIETDKPRFPGQRISVHGQSIPRSNVYLVYSAFRGEGVNLRSNIMFVRSRNCGNTWKTPRRISRGRYPHQGACIAIKPILGTVFVTWRRFSRVGTTGNDSIWVAKSISRGAWFQSARKVADLPPFDQPATDAATPIGIYLGESFRTNSYPTIAADDKSRVFIAWSQRGVGPAQQSRVVLTHSVLGYSWTAPTPIDNHLYLGHQFMPSMVCAQGKITLAWYDQRLDYSGSEYGFDDWIIDWLPYRHTIDVWAAQADVSSFPNFNWNFSQVSRYYFVQFGNNEAFQVQFSPPNLPLFQSGTIPFHGDYIDLAASPKFIRNENGKWVFNTTATESPIFHVAWTDNRDVGYLAPGIGYQDWTPVNPPQGIHPDYISPGRASCAGGNTASLRNQNVYTATVTVGVEARSPQNNKPLDIGTARAFVIYIKNNAYDTYDIKSFRLTIANQPPGGMASFLQFELLDTLDVMIAPFSTIARTVFVESSDPNASIQIDIEQIDLPGGTILPGGLTSTIILNNDPANPGVIGNDTEETHDVSISNPNIQNWFVNPNIANPNIANPNIANPNIVNPNIANPNIANPNIANPNIVNPNIVNPNVANPNIQNPNIANPNIVNPNIANPNIANVAPDGGITEVEWTVTNNGNTATPYTFRTLSTEPLPLGLYAQLLVYKVHLTPTIASSALVSDPNFNYNDCQLYEEPHHELLLNIINPNIQNPNIANPNIANPNIVNSAIENATFTLGPGEEAVVTLRIIDPGTTPGMMTANQLSPDIKMAALENFVGSLIGTLTSQPVDSADVKQGKKIPKIAASDLIITTESDLDAGTENVYYEIQLHAEGGVEPYTWTQNFGELPPGLFLSPSGLISGTPTAPGFYEFTVRVVDSDSPQQDDSQRFYIEIYDEVTGPGPLTITTTSLKGAVQGSWYGETLKATGGSGKRTWYKASGSFPEGIGLDSSGLISGTPLETGTFNFIIGVNDEMGGNDTQPLTLQVAAEALVNLIISGAIYDENQARLSGVLIYGLPGAPETDSNGEYSTEVPSGWSGTAIPFKVGYTFETTNPPYEDHIVYTNVTTDQFGQDYNGTFSAGGETAVTGNMEELRDMEVDAEGNVHVVGSRNGYFYTVKYDNNGNLLWEAEEGDPQQNNHANAVEVDPQGNVYVTGKANSNFYTVKYDSGGYFEWDDTYDGGFVDEPADIGIDVAGNVYVTGLSYNGPNDPQDNPDFCTIKYVQNEGGVSRDWVETYDGDGHDVPSGLEIDNEGNIFVAGYSFNGPTNLDDFFVLKYSPYSEIIGDAGYENAGTNDYINDIALDADGNIYLTGWQWSNDDLTTKDILTVKFSSDLTSNWSVTNGSGNYLPDEALAIEVDSEGFVYVTGWSNTFGIHQVTPNFITIKYDNSFNQEWIATYDGPLGANDEARDLVLDPFGNVYVTGRSQGTDGSYDFATVKYNSSGNQTWEARYSEPNVFEAARYIALDPMGNIWVSGVDDNGHIIIKYAQDYSSTLTITTESLPQGIMGEDYFAQLEAFGGSGTLTWSLVYGALPQGLELSQSGLIFGDPAIDGSWGFDVQVTDGVATDTQSLSIIINQTPTFTITVQSVPVSGGTVTLTPNLAAYPIGTQVTLQPVPTAGYTFSGWQGDVDTGHEMDNPLVINVNDNKVFTATFMTGPPVTNGLVSWWPGEGNAYDMVGGNHGTLNNDIDYVDPGDGSQAFNFDTVDEYISTTGNGINELNTITVEAWVRLNSISNRIDRFVTIWGFEPPNNLMEKAVIRHDGDTNPGQLHFYMTMDMDGMDYLTQHIRVNNVLQAGCWHHIVATYDFNYYMHLYLDGVEVGNMPVGWPLVSGNDQIFLSNPSDETLLGSLDDVRIYDRALSIEEIQNLYAAGHGAVCSPLPPPQAVILGNVRDYQDNAVEGVEIQIMDSFYGTTYTDIDGQFSFENLGAGYYWLYVSDSLGYNFEPDFHEVIIEDLDGEYVVDFIELVPAYEISGTITTQDQVPVPLQGVEITFDNGGGWAFTNSQGFYSISVDQGWSGTATPYYEGYSFTPETRTYTNIQADAPTQDYTAGPTPFTISGYVRDYQMNPLEGVLMDGLPGNPVTDPDGYYTATVPYGWSGMFEPTKIGYSFEPYAPSFSNVTSNETLNILFYYNRGVYFLVQPSSTEVDQPITPPVQVLVHNDDGPAGNALVTISIDNNAGPNGVLSGATTAVTNLDGEALFPNLSIDQAGTGYTLKAEVEIIGYGMHSVTSDPFDIEPVTTYGPNILPNPSFEDGSGDSPTDWLLAGPGLIEWTNERAHSGDYSVEIIETSIEFQTWHSMTNENPITVETEADYELSIWVYWTGMPGDDENLQLIIFAGTQDLYFSISNLSQTIIPGTWQQFTFDVYEQFQPGNDQATLEILKYAVGPNRNNPVVYVDDVSLRKKTVI